MRALLTALLAALAVSACAQAPPAGDPAIWRVRDENSEIWLFGTVHILPPEVRWRSQRVDAALASADEFVTETDTSADAALIFQALSAQYGALPAGESLSAQLEPEDQRLLERAVRDLELDPAALDRLRPWLAALQLTYAYAVREGHSAEAGVETVLGADARAQGKRLTFLETPEQQVLVLAQLAPEDERAFFLASLRQVASGDVDMSALDSAWARGDTDTLARLLDAEWEGTSPGVHEAIIVRRNRVWAEEIERRLAGEGRIFIAVGAAHLVGEDNVVTLLRARGVSVEGP